MRTAGLCGSPQALAQRSWRARMFAAAVVLFALPGTLHAEREFRVYESLEAQADVALPPDYEVPGEFVVGRLMYPTSHNLTRL